ncbi:cytochrome c [Alcanivorax sp. ZXX171]|nr:cytochrome c [Alcanivorax sp. ZXX171]
MFDGPFMSRGMPDFTGRLDKKDVEKLKAFIQGTADAVRAQQQQQKEK